MYRSKILILALAYCLLISFTARAQESYTPQYEEEYKEQEQQTYTPTYGATEEEEQQSYTPTYGATEEEEQQSYAPTYEEEEQEYEAEYEEEEEQQSYTYGGQPAYEEEYQEYEAEEYNYDQGSYAGNDTYSYGGNSSYGYGTEQGYTGGTYDSNSGSPSSSPKFPTSLLTGFVVDIHFLAVDINFQYIAYHYCSDLFPGYTQCAIYNGTASNSRLIATEQIVSAEIFQTLPLSERKLYHSHAFAVKNGLLILPGVPASQELKALNSAMNTYGKVVDYWHSYQDFPLGPPRLAYGLADVSQINNTIVDEMDKALNLNTTWQERRKQRESLVLPEKIEGADDYLVSGKYPQYVIKEFDVPSDSSSPSSSSSSSGGPSSSSSSSEGPSSSSSSSGGPNS